MKVQENFLEDKGEFKSEAEVNKNQKLSCCQEALKLYIPPPPPKKKKKHLHLFYFNFYIKYICQNMTELEK